MTAYFADDAVMYYEPGDECGLARCVLDIYQSPEKGARLAASASAIYQRYRWETMKYEYLRVFDHPVKGENSVLLGENRKVQS
jgi:hypothetical protein